MQMHKSKYDSSLPKGKYDGSLGNYKGGTIKRELQWQI